MSRIRLIAVLICLYVASAQLVAQAPGTGLYPFSSFDNRGLDSINIGNLNIHFQIPIVNKPGRGQAFNYSLSYDGLLWSAVTINGVDQWQPDIGWGFHGQLSGAQAYVGYLTYNAPMVSCGTYLSTNATNYVYHDAFGQQHAFNWTYNGCTYTVTGDGSSSDGSGYRLSNGSTGYVVINRYGTKTSVDVDWSASIAGTITDSNGNVISNNGNGTFTDTLGVTALTIAGGGNASSPLSFTYPVTLQADASRTASAAIYYRTYTVQTNFQCPGISEYGAASTDLVDHITLADGVSTYSFTYEPMPGVSGAVTGRLASVTLPTGGTIGYQYSGGCNGNGLNADGTTGGLTRTADGTRLYGRSPSANGSVTTLQDEVGNQGLYTFTNVGGMFYETHRQLYQGGVGGTPLLDQSTCYNGATPNCDGAASTLPIAQTATLSSYNGGLQLGVNNVYDASGMLTSSTQMSGSTVLESVHNSYNALEELTASTMEDGSGTPFASSSYGYDETTPTATSVIPQHNAVSGARGNQTSAHVSTGSTNLSTTTTYYDTGVPVATTTPNGTTQYGYDLTQTFATTTTLPTPSSGVQLATSASYDPQSGVQISATGMNPGQTVQYTQYDRLLRPTIVSLPNGGQINYTYVNPNESSVTQPMGNGQNLVTYTLNDAYGRLSRTAVYNGQAANGWYQVDYCYDATGNLSFQSTRYQSTGFIAPKQCSGSGTSYLYDALGRVTSSTTTDGSNSYQYNGRAVHATDVNGVQKITQYDLLGRVSGVCEISSNSSMPGSGSPVNCGMDIAGTGFLTNYLYDLVNHKATINQGAQTRVFQTDAAGRTTSVTEPERGTTGYSYAYNSTGLVVTRTRPKANQNSAGVLTTTTTQYDMLGRVITVIYDDGLTPNKALYYDTNPFISWSAETTTNLKGNLSITSTSNSAGTLLTSSLFSYDSMGRVTTMWQCTPSICGTSNQASRPALGFAYDLVGNLINEFDGVSGNIQYGRSPAGEVTSITNLSYTDPTNTPNLVSSVLNGPNGPISYQLGNGLGVANQYDGLGRVNARWVCSGSAQPNCSGGTQVYGFNTQTIGAQIVNSCDSALGQCYSYGYDEFSRLASASIYYGPTQNFTYVYDRYGNRLQQNAPQGGPAPSYSVNTSNNQILGLGYDAAGNLINDGFHSYTYDAEGNVVSADGGSTAQYVYDALNRRVSVQNAGGTVEYLFDNAGRRISSWPVGLGYGNQGRIFWGSDEFASRDYNGSTYFNHRDYTGTVRAHTDYTGALSDTHTSLPWGDGLGSTPSNSPTGQDTLDFAGLDLDYETLTQHAQFRQYSSTQGRWMSPDPYNGSYDASNPQSFNRYAYVENNPLGFTDPRGQCMTTNVLDDNGNVIQTSTVGNDCPSLPTGPGPSTDIPWYISEYGSTPCDPPGVYTGKNQCPNQQTPVAVASTSVAPINGTQRQPSQCQGLVFGAIAVGALSAMDEADAKVETMGDGITQVIGQVKAAAPYIGVGTWSLLKSIGEPTLGIAAGAFVDSGVAEGAAIVGGGYLTYVGIQKGVQFYKEQNAKCN